MMNRRKILKASFLGALGVSAAGLTQQAVGSEPTGAPTTARRYDSTADAVDWVLGAFNKKDVVALGEGDHGLQESHDFILNLICHPDFGKQVDAIAVEWGNPMYQETTDAFVQGQPVKLSDLQLSWRNTCVSPVQTWDAPVYHRLLTAVKTVNLARTQQPLRVILADTPFDWTECNTADDLMPALMERDNNMAKAVGDAAASGAKTLFLAGGAHIAHLETGPRTAGMQLKERLPGKVLTIETHCNVAPEHAAEVEELLRGWPRPGIRRLSGTELGEKPASWFFPAVQPAPGDSPSVPATAGADAKTTLEQAVDAYLWLRPRADLTRSVVDPAVYLNERYWAELERRNGIIPFAADIQKYRTEANPQFFPSTGSAT